MGPNLTLQFCASSSCSNRRLVRLRNSVDQKLRRSYFMKRYLMMLAAVDYQGGRYVLPEPAGGETVPTLGMVNSGFTNLQDNITYNSGTANDALGRTFPHGTI